MNNILYSSLCRISDLKKQSFKIEAIPKSRWETGDYVIGKVSSRPSPKSRIESPTGRTIEPLEGEYIIGAFGIRRATRGIVGDWKNIDSEDGKMEVIGEGGVMGLSTSKSPFKPSPIPLKYQGHVHIENSKRNMEDYVTETQDTTFDLPVIQILGTSMSSGKTMSGRVIVQTLSELGLDTIACKLTGSGRYQDALSMKDAGAKNVFDFVDAGFPTTVLPPDKYRPGIRNLLSKIDPTSADILVVELGASPIEPYNGEIAIEELKDNVVFSVITASDPYAILGFKSLIKTDIDLITGITTNTESGINLVEELTKTTALNLQLEQSKKHLKSMLKEKISVL